ncbi:MAG: vitamin K epoxide reductase family protein [Candidatus Colwellbacteria bacterium]
MHWRIAGSSMRPEFSSGSLVFATKLFKLRVGDVVVLKDPRNGERIIVKRVSRIDGDKVMLLGDNPSESTDSRGFGLVDKGNILGKVIFKYPQNTGDWLRPSLVIFSFGGLLDAAYLTFKHFEGGEVACGVIPGAECDLVLGSIYSQFMGIPLALIGILYYLTVLILSAVYLKSKKDQLMQLLAPLTASGFLVSLYLIYLQIFAIGAFCSFCLISAFTSTALFGIAMAIVVLRRKGRDI